MPWSSNGSGGTLIFIVIFFPRLEPLGPLSVLVVEIEVADFLYSRVAGRPAMEMVGMEVAQY